MLVHFATLKQINICTLPTSHTNKIKTSLVFETIFQEKKTLFILVMSMQAKCMQIILAENSSS